MADNPIDVVTLVCIDCGYGYTIRADTPGWSYAWDYCPNCPADDLLFPRITNKGAAVVESGLSLRQAHEIETACSAEIPCGECQKYLT